jgi:hypothetical protein
MSLIKMVKKKTKIKKRKPTPASNKKDVLKLVSYEITEEPMIDEVYESLPETIQDELKDIHGKIHGPIHKDSDRIVSRLEELVKQYPHVPQISNYLAAAYNLTGSNKFEQCVEDNYKKHPDYLFARVHYAGQCMDNNDLEKIPEIFKVGYDLKVLYPHRNRFHISEFIAFNALMCRYFDSTGKRHAAEVMLKSLEKIAPEHPATKQAKRCMQGSLLDKLLTKIKQVTSNNEPLQSTDEDKPSSFEA